MCATSVCGCGDLDYVRKAKRPSVDKPDRENVQQTQDDRVLPVKHKCQPKKDVSEPLVGLKQDLLAKVVLSHRAALDLLKSFHDKALAYPKIRTLIESSQPTHFLAIAAVAVVCSTIYGGGQGSHHRPSSIVPAIYLISNALHFGAQFWMTFVSGLTLYFSLSRHAFGDVQQVLFPRYFTLNSLFSCASLLSFAKLHNHLDSWNSHHYAQTCCLGFGFLVETLARLYMAPRVLAAMSEVRRLELQVDGVGKEVGRHVPGSLASSPDYITAYSSFRKAHSCMAIANILSISCTTAHLIYLASTIHFS